MTLLTPIDAVAQQDAVKAINLHKQYHGGKRQAIDIGANIGNYSKQFIKYFDSVIAFEPNKDHNTMLESIQNLAVHNVALSNANEQVDYYKFEMHSVNSISLPTAKWHETKYGQKPESETVFTKCLDVFDTQPDLIKIDVEGLQHKVIQGAINTIKQHKPTMIIDSEVTGPKYLKFVETQKEADDKMDDFSLLFDLGYVNMTEQINVNKKSTDCFVHTSRIAEILVNSFDG